MGFGLCRVGFVWCGFFSPGNVKGLSHANSLDLARMLAELGSLLLVEKRRDEPRGKEGVVAVFLKKGQNAIFFLSPLFSLSFSVSTFFLFFNIEIPCWNMLSMLVLSKPFTGVLSLQEMLW